MVECANATDELNWDTLLACQPLPLGLDLLLFLLACWVFFLIVVMVRGIKHSCSATKDTVVAKKLQIFQTWFYSFFYTMVYATTLFSAASLMKSGETVSAGFLFFFIIMSQCFASTIDVVGSTNRKPGNNSVSFLITFQHLITSYLPKAVWKTSGHREFDQGAENQKFITKMCCLGSLDNHITPKVYDVKDIATIQGAFLGLPSLMVYLLTYVRSIEQSTGSVVSAVFNQTLGANDVAAAFDFNIVVTIGAILAFLSALLPPILGDWEAFARDYHYGTLKTIGYTGVAVSKRLLELFGRAGLYVYLIDVSKFSGLVLLGAETFAMYSTYVDEKDSSAGGRTGTVGHLLLSSFEAVFYGSYRRISVDKEFTTQGNAMSTTIELVRYLEKGAATLVAYFWILGASIPESYVKAQEDAELMPILFFLSLAANVLLVPTLVVEYLIVKRGDLHRSELKRLYGYWKGWWVCRNICCCPKQVHITRDNYMGSGINYV